MQFTRFSLLAFVIATAACREYPTCQVNKKRFYTKETNIIVIDKGPIGNSFLVRGIDPITGKSISYTDVDGIYNYVYSNLEVGDTLSKARNSAEFLIKRRAIDVFISYNCLDGSYMGGSTLDTLPKLTYEKMIVDTIPKSSLR